MQRTRTATTSTRSTLIASQQYIHHRKGAIPNMITPQHTSGDYPPMGIPQRNGSVGGNSLEHINSAIGQSSMARNRIPSLSTSTISSVEDDHSPRNGSSFYHSMGPPSIPHSDITIQNGALPIYGDIHNYSFNSMGQRTEWPENALVGIRQPAFDSYNNNSGSFLPPPGYTTGPGRPNYPVYNTRSPMMPPSGLNYDKISYHQDSMNRQPPTSYGFQDSFSGDPTLRPISNEQIRESSMQAHPHYLQDRRTVTQIPIQQSTIRDLGDHQYGSLFGSIANQDRMPQDPYTIHDIQAFDFNRTASIANSAKAQMDQERNVMNSNQYTFPISNITPQSYVDSRSSFATMNGGAFIRQPLPPQNSVYSNPLYSYTDPPLMGDGNSLYRLDHPNNMIHSGVGSSIYEQQLRPAPTDRLVDNLTLLQSTLQISSTSSANGPVGDTRQYFELPSNLESQSSLNPSQPENRTLPEDKYHDSTDILVRKETSTYIQRVDYQTEQAIVSASAEDVPDTDAKVSPSLSSSSVRTQDKSYLTVLQSSGTQKDTQVQGVSSTSADAAPSKWKQAVVNTPVSSASMTPAKIEPKYLYHVKFKRATEVFKLDQHMMELKPGNFVKVEADRGHDMGTVVSRMPFSEYDAESRQSNASERFDKNILEKSKGQNNESTIPTLKKILRVATVEEITMLQTKQKDEDDILNQCRTKAKQRGLTMNVIDAEYQFDRNKLTFYFQAQGRVDFRDLVKDLFGICKTRIWMQQIDKKPSSSLSTTSSEVIG